MSAPKASATAFRENMEAATRMAAEYRTKAMHAHAQLEQEAEDYVNNRTKHRETGLDRPYGDTVQDAVYGGMAVAKDTISSNKYEKSRADTYAALAAMWSNEALMWGALLQMELEAIRRKAAGR